MLRTSLSAPPDIKILSGNPDDGAKSITRVRLAVQGGGRTMRRKEDKKIAGGVTSIAISVSNIVAR
jgi:hypothetical protein